MDAPHDPLALARSLPVSFADPDPTETPRGGPRTPEGKERSRRNALKHGLRSKTLLPDDLADAVAARTIEFTTEFAPASPYENWLVGQQALAATRLDRCAELAIADLERRVDRALLFWDEDRRHVAEDLGAGLARDPSRVARALARTRQGADWLIERWEGLGEALQAEGDWDDARRSLAFDLLGIPTALRKGRTVLPPAADATTMAALVARELARLREDQDVVLDRLDDAERGMAGSGMPMEEDAPSIRLRRYESSCRRELRWTLAELRRVRAQAPSALATPLPPPEQAPSAAVAGPAPPVVAARPRLELPPPPAPLPAAVPPVREPDRTTLCPPPAAPRNRQARRALEKQERRKVLVST